VSIPASLVKELRDQTGAGMMDCKRALEEAQGEFEAARLLLREKGIALAGKRAGREIKEGKVGYRIREGVGTLVAVGCETEPVSENEEFLAFAERVLDAVEREGPGAAATLEQERIELVAKLGENISVVGETRMTAAEGEELAAYAHPPANRIGVLLRGTGSAEAARRLAMHISFAAPRYAMREEVPAEDVAAERAILERLDEVESKPEAVRPRIVEGMLAKRFFAESVLTDQMWIHDTGKTVEQALREEGFEVREFARYSVAG